MTKTEIINLLLGNNNCSCVNIQCLGGLYAVVSSPDLEDALCPVYSRGSSCYSPSFCGQFQGTPFFRICQNPSESGCTYSICFENITEQLNGTKLDFFILTRTLCEEIIYITRTYISSFEIKGNKLTSNLNHNKLLVILILFLQSIVLLLISRLILHRERFAFPLHHSIIALLLA